MICARASPRVSKGSSPFATTAPCLGHGTPGCTSLLSARRAGDLVRALADKPSLPKPVREVAILVTGAHFKAAYELYAHVLVGEQRGLSDEKLATIVAGQRPVDLTRDEAIAYDFASALVNGGVLPELTYKTAIMAFGQHGATELSYLVGLYALVSITLNTFDVPVPEA
jgi:4-carboxymuconolactone decarboxylase